MKLKGKIFKNSKKYINEGIESGQGILYCGDKYTNESGCPCSEHVMAIVVEIMDVLVQIVIILWHIYYILQGK